LPKLKNELLKPDRGAPGRTTATSIADGRVMLLGIPVFGLSIPLLTGLYGPIGPRDAGFWLGCAYFVALSAAIWLGNRWLLLQQRRHLDWFDQPARKLMMLIAANVLYTAPLTGAWLLGWYASVGRPPDWPAIQLVTLTNVICVIFVTHAYETVFLIRERETDFTRVERLERARVEGELAALTAQIDPHFLFNSLNTLGHVIAHDPMRARDFCDRLAEVYRYVLAARGQQLVPLADELAFLGNYYELLSLRFGVAIDLRVSPDVRRAAEDGGLALPPLALQTLLENAVKHNQADAQMPLCMEVSRDGDAIRFAHARRPRSSTRIGAGLGLRNLDERCRLLAGRALSVDDTAAAFVVTVPLAAR
jgi:hypothetical protein